MTGHDTVDVDAWFARRTTHARDDDLDDLVARRRAAGTTVSVVLPARNEEATVAGVVAAALRLVPHLVDEVVVMDGGSTDGSVGRARQAGARVHADADVPPGPPSLGKGDALWRSLRVTSGDLVVFADTDVRNPAPEVFAALLGPLLSDPTVHYVKAFYDRPLEIDGVHHDAGGGRVTELTARPLLNLWWPQLAGLAQPLSGEYAGRRTLLERLPFFTGYGVELGLLIDVARVAGVDAIAQVDVGVRLHRNQSLDALSRMAFGVAQVASRRRHPGADGDAPLDARRYRQVHRDREGRPHLAGDEVRILERPPLHP